MADKQWIVRSAELTDVAELLRIYTPYVEKTAITFEYDVPSIDEFIQRVKTIQQRYPYLVCESSEGEIVGYAYASTYKGRTAYDWTVETSIYMDQSLKGRGAGSVLYQALEEQLKKQNVYVLLACITAGNAESVGFHEKFAYREVAYFPNLGYKNGEWLDVLWMQKELQPIQGSPNPFIPNEFVGG